MAQTRETSAWLETKNAGRIDVRALCTFGRTAGNTVILDTPKASRRHAMIHEQDGEFWIVDLGSTNGFLVDGHRVTHPVRLQNGDPIQMPDTTYIFRQAEKPAAPLEKRRAPPLKQNRLTIADIRLTKCWILLADIKGFTQMSQQVPAGKLAPLVGTWMGRCQDILRNHKGVLAKFLGDGFMAYWTGDDENVESIASACREFQELEKSTSLPFRIMVHHGVISFGGHSPDASHTMMGPELNFAFRLEKVASRLNLLSIFSAAAATRLQDYLPLKSCGTQNVPDFAPERICFTLAT